MIKIEGYGWSQPLIINELISTITDKSHIFCLKDEQDKELFLPLDFERV